MSNPDFVDVPFEPDPALQAKLSLAYCLKMAREASERERGAMVEVAQAVVRDLERRQGIHEAEVRDAIQQSRGEARGPWFGDVSQELLGAQAVLVALEKADHAARALTRHGGTAVSVSALTRNSN